MWLRQILTHDVELRFLYLCLPFPRGVDNKVFNGGEKVHFTPRLKPNPLNPSSFYASPEPTLHWPTTSQSRSSSRHSASLQSPLQRTHANSHTHTNMHECEDVVKEREKNRSAFNSPWHINPFWDAATLSGPKKLINKERIRRQTRVKNMRLICRHGEWLLWHPVSFKQRYHS